MLTLIPTHLVQRGVQFLDSSIHTVLYDSSCTLVLVGECLDISCMCWFALILTIESGKFALTRCISSTLSVNVVLLGNA